MFPFDSVFSISNPVSTSTILCWKARLKSFENVESIIFEHMECLGTLVLLEDTYFNATKGTLKLRMVRNNHNSELIYVGPSDLSVERLREISSVVIENGDATKDTLSLALGIIGVVQKRRRIFVKDNIRICLDSVKQLGDFITVSAKMDNGLENCMGSSQYIQKKLQIASSELIYSSYLTLLRSSIPVFDDNNSNDNYTVSTLPTIASSTSEPSDQQTLLSESLIS